MSNKKEQLKERVEQRQQEAQEIKKVHEQLEALREIHKQENATFAAQRANLIFKEEIQNQGTDPKVETISTQIIQSK